MVQCMHKVKGVVIMFFEEYKDEIKAELEKDKILGCMVVNKLMGNTCNDYPKCNDCYLKVLDWLLQEYKEPILTDEAKSYLKLILEPSKCTIIQKLVEGEETPRKYKLFCITDSGYIAILYKPGTKYYEYFKNMKDDKAYTPEELDL